MTTRPTISSLAATAILVVAVLLPVAWLDHLAACPWKALTHTPCPGCGMTRAFVSVGHVDMVNAWRANPAVFTVFPLIVWFALEPWLRPRWPAPAIARTLRWAIALTLAALLATWLYRLIPVLI